jgi:hypothetical protein
VCAEEVQDDLAIRVHVLGGQVVTAVRDPDVLAATSAMTFARASSPSLHSRSRRS